MRFIRKDLIFMSEDMKKESEVLSTNFIDDFIKEDIAEDRRL